MLISSPHLYARFVTVAWRLSDNLVNSSCILSHAPLRSRHEINAMKM
jgi:hypothetical protein